VVIGQVLPPLSSFAQMDVLVNDAPYDFWQKSKEAGASVRQGCYLVLRKIAISTQQVLLSNGVWGMERLLTFESRDERLGVTDVQAIQELKEELLRESLRYEARGDLGQMLPGAVMPRSQGTTHILSHSVPVSTPTFLTHFLPALSPRSALDLRPERLSAHLLPEQGMPVESFLLSTPTVVSGAEEKEPFIGPMPLPSSAMPAQSRDSNPIRGTIHTLAAVASARFSSVSVRQDQPSEDVPFMALPVLPEEKESVGESLHHEKKRKAKPINGSLAELTEEDFEAGIIDADSEKNDGDIDKKDKSKNGKKVYRSRRQSKDGKRSRPRVSLSSEEAQAFTNSLTEGRIKEARTRGGSLFWFHYANHLNSSKQQNESEVSLVASDQPEGATDTLAAEVLDVEDGE
jgi:hypothetical protein